MCFIQSRSDPAQASRGLQISRLGGTKNIGSVLRGLEHYAFNRFYCLQMKRFLGDRTHCSCCRIYYVKQPCHRGPDTLFWGTLQNVGRCFVCCWLYSPRCNISIKEAWEGKDRKHEGNLFSDSWLCLCCSAFRWAFERSSSAWREQSSLNSLPHNAGKH